MNELRWILVGFAIVVLAAIYLWGRKASTETSKHEPALRSRPEPAFTQDSSTVSESPSDDDVEWQARGEGEQEISSFEAVDEPPAARASEQITMERPVEREGRRVRVEPTFSDAPVTEELPVSSESATATTNEPSASTTAEAPTLSSGDSPPPKRIERRKILSLRLSAIPHRIDGSRLRAALEAEQLQHGKYAVFHRLHDNGASIFSVASMVEPGTFDLEKMAETQYPGITLFAQLPGPVPGMHALNELVACARRLQQNLNGTLQDDRGVPLTVHRIERMRQEVREFERPTQGGGRSLSSTTARL